MIDLVVKRENIYTYSMLNLIMLALCAIPGVPEAPSDNFLVSWSNDSHLSSNDNYRTNSFKGVGRMGEFVISINHSMLTDIQDDIYSPSIHNGVRNDEITMTFGKEFTYVIIGGGIRSYGDFGGQTLQNKWHKISGYKEVDVVYECSETAVVAYCSSEFVKEPFYLTSSVMVGTDRGVAFDIATHMIKVDGDGVRCWIGPRYQYRYGADGVVATVARYETGVWIDFGLNVMDRFAIEARFGPRTGANELVISFGW